MAWYQILWCQAPSYLCILGHIWILECYYVILCCDAVVVVVVEGVCVCVYLLDFGEITRLSYRDKAEINPFGCHGFTERSDCRSLWC